MDKARYHVGIDQSNLKDFTVITIVKLYEDGYFRVVAKYEQYDDFESMADLIDLIKEKISGAK